MLAMRKCTEGQRFNWLNCNGIVTQVVEDQEQVNVKLTASNGITWETRASRKIIESGAIQPE
jgi:hypothetical protein